MFGIGLPEMIIIFAIALIVVGPDKLPGLARSLAKGLMEMKKAVEQVKENLTQEGEVLDSVQKDLKKTADELRVKMIDADPSSWELPPTDPYQEGKETDVIDLQQVTDPKAASTPIENASNATTTESTGTEPEASGQQPAESLQKIQQTDPANKPHV
jgi:sec-independent protein translocase protein TatB